MLHADIVSRLLSQQFLEPVNVDDQSTILRPKAGSMLEGKMEVEVRLGAEGQPIVTTRIPR